MHFDLFMSATIPIPPLISSFFLVGYKVLFHNKSNVPFLCPRTTMCVLYKTEDLGFGWYPFSLVILLPGVFLSFFLSFFPRLVRFV